MNNIDELLEKIKSELNDYIEREVNRRTDANVSESVSTPNDQNPQYDDLSAILSDTDTIDQIFDDQNSNDVGMDIPMPPSDIKSDDLNTGNTIASAFSILDRTKKRYQSI